MKISYAWTFERCQQLMAMAKDGWSFYLIAQRLGCTRNAAIGKAHRLAIKTGNRPPPKSNPKREKRKYRKPSNPPLTGVLSLRAISPRAIPQPPRIVPAGVPVGILDVTGCRYAVGTDAKVPGTHIFCNAATANDLSWCDFHRSIVTQDAWGKFAMKRMGP